MAVGVYGEPATLDPYSRYASDLTRALIRPVYRSLFRMQPDGSASRDLAASIEVLPGGARIVIAEAEWSDGSAVTAADVAASIRRARRPSGFAEIDGARVLDDRTIEVRGIVDDWPETLARSAFVMPNGRPGVTGGPWTIVDRVPGLKLVYEPIHFGSDRPFLDRMTVFFVDSDATLRTLLENEEIDVAALPATANLTARLEAEDLNYQSARGSELIVIDLRRSDLSAAQRRFVLGSLPVGAMQSRLLRDVGDVATDPPDFEAADDGIPIRLTIPEGDELLGLIQRAVYERLAARDREVELASLDTLSIYARTPKGVVIKRVNGDRDDVASNGVVPLFEVDTVVAYSDRVMGVDVNPWVDGVLWDAESWSLAPR